MATNPVLDVSTLTTSPTAAEALEAWYKDHPPVFDPNANPRDVSRADLYSKDLWRAPFAEMRANAPINKVEDSAYGSYWNICNHKAIQHIEALPDIFSSAAGGIVIADRREDDDSDFELPMFIAMDRPKHTGQRRTVAPAFTPTEMKRMEDEIRHRTAEVLDSLPRAPGDGAPLPPPGGVERREICWPLGTAAESQPGALCQQRLQAWVLDGVIPPTFAERDARLWSAGRIVFEVDPASGRRLSAGCTGGRAAEQREIARWPALLSPWLPAAQRSASRLPPLATGCADDGRQALDELRIDGVQDGARLARPPGSTRGVRLALRALGATGEVQWLLDGRWVAQTTGGRAFVHQFDQPGSHALTALADSGAWARVEFQVLR